MTALLAINDLTIDKTLDRAAMGNVLGRGTHCVYLGSKTYFGNWNFYKKIKYFKGYLKYHGKWHRKYRIDYWYKQTNYKRNSYCCAYQV